MVVLFLNDLNRLVDDSIIEIKVYERGQQVLEFQYILRDNQHQDAVRSETIRLLHERMSSTMEYEIKFVDFIFWPSWSMSDGALATLLSATGSGFSVHSGSNSSIGRLQVFHILLTDQILKPFLFFLES